MRGDGTIACPSQPASQPTRQTNGRMRKADIGFGVLQRRCGLNLLSAVLGKETSGPVNALALVRHGIGVSERFIALPIWIRRPFLPFLVGILPLSSPYPLMSGKRALCLWSPPASLFPPSDCDDLQPGLNGLCQVVVGHRHHRSKGPPSIPQIAVLEKLFCHSSQTSGQRACSHGTPH